MQKKIFKYYCNMDDFYKRNIIISLSLLRRKVYNLNTKRDVENIFRLRVLYCGQD